MRINAGRSIFYDTSAPAQDILLLVLSFMALQTNERKEDVAATQW